jgi:N-acetyl-gamma-glutamyl-phosphate reductase
MDVALFGAGGYTGVELAKLLAGHPNVRLACAASDSLAGRPVAELTGRRGPLAFSATDAARLTAARCAIAFLAVPPELARCVPRT